MSIQVTTLEEVQEYFDTNILQLMEKDEDSIDYIEQNHFGDLLVEFIEDGHERFKLWRNLDCNVAEGESLIQVEYSGKLNGYRWETIFELNEWDI